MVLSLLFNDCAPSFNAGSTTPDEFVAQRNSQYQKQAENQMDAVDSSFMRQSDPRAPLFKESKSTVTFGKG